MRKSKVELLKGIAESIGALDSEFRLPSSKDTRGDKKRGYDPLTFNPNAFSVPRYNFNGFIIFSEEKELWRFTVDNTPSRMRSLRSACTLSLCVEKVCRSSANGSSGTDSQDIMRVRTAPQSCSPYHLYGISVGQANTEGSALSICGVLCITI